MSYTIEAYRPGDQDDVLALSLRAWDPVFTRMKEATPAFVLDAFYPQGWQVRQSADISAFLNAEGNRTLVAREYGRCLGFVGTRTHPEDHMGEIYIIAVDPAHQRRGIASALMQAAFETLRAEGFAMVMVETGGDPGHAASRATYESFGFERWPVARYFKKL